MNAAGRGAAETRRLAAWLDLLQEALAQRGAFVLPLRGSSMRPTLPEACDIRVVPLSGEPAVGQLIVFVLGDALVAHRLVRRAGAFWIAQGDNRLGPDRALKREQMLGCVAAASVGERQVWPGRFEAVLAVLWVARYHALRGARWGVRSVRGGVRRRKGLRR